MPQRKPHHSRNRAQEHTARLTKLREEAGLSQKDLGGKLGKSRFWVCRVETGERQANNVILCNWASACGVRPELVLGQQLQLPLLIAIVAPAQVATELLDEVREFLSRASEEQKMELRRYLAFLRIKAF